MPLSSCIEFEGCKNSRGYGMRWHEGSMKLAHRVEWEEVHGPIPKDLCVCHSCDNPPCINTDHLFLGTHQDNMDDMKAKGRGVPPPTYRGSNNTNAALNEEDIKEIRSKYKAGATQTVLAAEYGVSQPHISKIVRRELWPQVR